jgi:hypothetical protein
MLLLPFRGRRLDLAEAGIEGRNLGALEYEMSRVDDEGWCDGFSGADFELEDPAGRAAGELGRLEGYIRSGGLGGNLVRFVEACLSDLEVLDLNQPSINTI